MHYLDSNNVVDKDFQKDQKLPFKSHEGISFSTAIGFIPISFVTLKSIFSSIIKKEILLFNDHLISFDVASNIWQPPKH